MHGSCRIGQLPIEIFIDIASGVGEVVFKIVNDAHVVMNISATV